MKTKTAKRTIVKTALGAVVGGAMAGPIGAVAGGLAGASVEPKVKPLARRKPTKNRRKVAADDPPVHAHPQRILVPLDFSLPSKRAMRFAREWASLFGAKVCLLHVLDPVSMTGEFGIAPLGTVQRTYASRAKAALAELARAEFPDSIPVTVAVRKGKAFDQIAAVARDLRADLIIIATHGYTGLKHVLLGSTAERVARHSPCPVLILRRRRNR